TYSSSNDGSGSVWVAADTTPGVFNVYGTHVYNAGSAYFTVKVTDQGDPRSPTPDLGGEFTGATSAAVLVLSNPAVVVTAGPTCAATEGATSSVQTVATFTDPGVLKSSAQAYKATVNWGDGTSTTASLTGQGQYSGPDATGFIFASNVAGIVLGSDG